MAINARFRRKTPHPASHARLLPGPAFRRDMLPRRAARTIMLVCSLFARLPRYGPSAAGTTRYRDSARLDPAVHEPAARDSLRYSLIPRRVVKIGLLIRRFEWHGFSGRPRSAGRCTA